MPEKHLRTSDLARAAGISVNTVRLYEQLGFLPPVPRAANGYRLFTERHLKHVHLVRQAMRCTWVGGRIRHAALEALTSAAQGDYVTAYELAALLLDLIRTEQAYAEEAVRVLERWALRPTEQKSAPALSIGRAAQRLHLTIDELRSWERNGLLTVPRAPNGYRSYGPEQIDRLLVIRTLRRARYSTMAILRILRSLDAGQTGALRDLLDMPFPDAEIEDYPTNTWLSTLSGMAQAAESMLCILAELANPP